MLFLECGWFLSKKFINLDRLIDCINFFCNVFLGFILFCFKFMKSLIFELIVFK